MKFLVGVAMNSVRSGIDAERTWTVETGMSSFTVAKTLIDIILDIEVVAIVKVEIGTINSRSCGEVNSDMGIPITSGIEDMTRWIDVAVVAKFAICVINAYLFAHPLT